jgi:hypothetical protein
MNRPVRILLPWVDEGEAIAALLGFRFPNPGEDISFARQLHAEQTEALRRRPEFVPPRDVITALPESHRERSAAFLAAVRTHGAPPLQVGVVDLRSLLGFQKVVALDQIEARLGGVAEGDWDALLDLCLPIPDHGAEIEGTFDRDGRGLTISSLNPNLRVSPLQQVRRGEGEGAPGEQLVGFNVSYGASHVHVLEYRGRVYLKDGYHRCYGLLARGVTHAPCTWAAAPAFNDVVGAGSAHVAAEHLLGPRPPLLRDFLDDSVSATVQQRSLRKVVRIRAEEFVVHV